MLPTIQLLELSIIIEINSYSRFHKVWRGKRVPIVRDQRIKLMVFSILYKEDSHVLTFLVDPVPKWFCCSLLQFYFIFINIIILNKKRHLTFWSGSIGRNMVTQDVKPIYIFPYPVNGRIDRYVTTGMVLVRKRHNVSYL